MHFFKYNFYNIKHFNRITNISSENLLLTNNYDYTLLDYILDNSIELDYYFSIDDNPKIMSIYLKHNMFPPMFYSEDDFYLTEVDGVRLIDILLNNLDDNEILKHLNRIENKDIAFSIIEKGKYILLKNASEYIQTLKYKDKLIFELYLQNVPNERISFSINNVELAYLCIKYNRLDLLLYSTEDIYISTYEGKTIFEYILMHYTDEEIINSFYCYSKPEIAYLCIKYNRLNLLQKLSESALLCKYNNSSILEVYISNVKNSKIKFVIKDVRTLQILCNEKNVKYLNNCNIKATILLNYINEKETYLEYILKNRVNINISQIEELNNYSMALIYLKLMQHNKININNINNINTNRLFDNSNDKSIFKYLCEFDAELTFNKLVKPLIYGMINSDIEDGILDKIIKEYETLNKEYMSFLGPLTEYDNKLLFEFKEKYNLDSDCALLSSYNSGLISNKEFFRDEIKKLLKIKRENNLTFGIDKTSYYSRDDNKVYVSSNLPSFYNHEVTHAINYNIDEYNYSGQFDHIMNRIINNPQTIKNIKLFSNDAQALLNECEMEAQVIYEQLLKNNLSEKLINEYNEKIMKLKKRILSNYKIRSFFGKNTNKYVKELFDINNYLEYSKSYNIKSLGKKLMHVKYSIYFAISDIIDAIYCGEYHDDNIKDEENNTIKCLTGHGSLYYAGKNNRFNEIIADYAEIKKSYNGEVGIEILRSVIGNEFVDALEDFYTNIILGKNNVRNINGKVLLLK